MEPNRIFFKKNAIEQKSSKTNLKTNNMNFFQPRKRQQQRQQFQNQQDPNLFLYEEELEPSQQKQKTTSQKKIPYIKSGSRSNWFEDYKRNKLEQELKRGRELNKFLLEGISDLKTHPDQLICRQNQKNLLMNLCQSGMVSLANVSGLIKRGADPNIVSNDDHKKTPLMMICSNSKVSREILLELIEQGNANVNLVSEEGKTALLYLCENRAVTVDLLGCLIESGADPKFVNSNTGQTALFCLCLNDSDAFECIQSIIVDHSCDPNKKDKFGSTPLFHLSHQKNGRLTANKLKSLVDNGAKLRTSTEHNSILVQLFRNHSINSQIVTYLVRDLQMGNEISKCMGANNRNCLFLLCSNNSINHKILVSLFSDNSITADPNCKDTYYKRTPLMALCSNSHITLKTLQVFLKLTQADPNLVNVDKYGESALSCLCSNSQVNPNLIQTLIDFGANCKKIDGKGKSALMAIGNNTSISIGTIKILIENGCDPNKRSQTDNSSAFSDLFCVINNQITHEIIKFYLKNGADPNSQNKYGYTPFHRIFQKLNLLNPENVKIMLEAGADPNVAETLKGNSPLLTLFSNIKNWDHNALKMIFLMVKYGANTQHKNFDNKSWNDFFSFQKEFTKNFVTNIMNINFNMLSSDFKNFFETGDFSDIKICGNILVHKLIIEKRLGLKFEIVDTILKQQDREVVSSLLNWVYSNEIPKSEKMLTLLHELFKKFQLPISHLSIALKDTLSELWNDDNSKDFTIIVENKPIKVHKMVLQARSQLFKGLFFSSKDSDELSQIKDYSGKSFEVVLLVMKYIYLGTVDLNLVESFDKKLINQLTDCVEYFATFLIRSRTKINITDEPKDDCQKTNEYWKKLYFEERARYENLRKQNGDYESNTKDTTPTPAIITPETETTTTESTDTEPTTATTPETKKATTTTTNPAKTTPEKKTTTTDPTTPEPKTTTTTTTTTTEDSRLQQKTSERTKKRNKLIQERMNNAKDSKYVVRLVPHTHLDPGWQKTAEEYYLKKVKPILNSVTKALMEDESLRFNWVETFFLQRWFRDEETSEQMKDNFRSLVENERMDLVGGGIVMSDNANVMYQDEIDQLTDGHTWLRENILLDEADNTRMPKYAWHIDPFGMSSYNPTLWSDMCLDGFVMFRVGYLENEGMAANKTLQFIWRSRPSYSSAPESSSDPLSGGRAHIPWQFTHTLGTSYWDVPSFHFEHDDSDEVTGVNIKDRAERFVALMKEKAETFQNNFLIQIYGCDFCYQQAYGRFLNMAWLMDYINSHPEEYDMDIQWATATEAFDELYAQDLEFPVSEPEKSFFPYIDGYGLYGDRFWTGYYSQRPKLKGLIRKMSNLARTADIFWSMGKRLAPDSRSDLVDHHFANVMNFRHAVGTAQHHDTITGTSPPQVLQDTFENLANAKAGVEPTMNWLLQGLQDSQGFEFKWSITNIEGSLQKSQSAIFVVLNNLAWKRNQWIQIPLHELESFSSFDVSKLEILYFQRQKMDSQDIAIINNHLYIYVMIDPLGFETFQISLGDYNQAHDQDTNANNNRNKKNNYNTLNTLSSEEPIIETEKEMETKMETETETEMEKQTETKTKRKMETETETEMEKEEYILSNKYYKITFDQKTGQISKIKNLKSNIETKFNQTFRFYRSVSDYSPWILSISKTPSKAVSRSRIKLKRYSSGKNGFIQEVHQPISDYVYQIVRLYENEPFIELDMKIGEVPELCQLVSSFETDWDTEKAFYTDAFGKKLFSEWKLKKEEHRRFTGEEYRPLVHTALIRNKREKTQLTLITDRGHGAASLKSGQLEIMYIRRDNYHDGRHYWNQDTSVTFQKTWVSFGTIQEEESKRAKNALLHNRPLSIMYSNYDQNLSTMSNPSFRGIQTQFPDYLHLLTMKQKSPNSQKFWLRVNNLITPETENSFVKKSIFSNLADLLQPKTVTEATETTLTGLSSVDSCKRKLWKSNLHDWQAVNPKQDTIKTQNLDEILELVPGEIRTFEVTFREND
ncbi:alpha-mannosidase [Anaeramoeba flamelloides]|uniref:Alpha-mannosidase n=1 Tax=Anaeramoeba flamelloides TaxID=1746091 RepID=A0ABQ8XR80_9EUKA|nr:alpha-mannosidase [Anaeramoeba flamelloides]